MDSMYVLHDSDYDGLGARYAAWKALGDDAEYIELDHGDDRDGPPLDRLPDDPAHVYVLDYSWDVDALYDLASVHELTVIDHHPTFGRSMIDRHQALFDQQIEGEQKAFNHTFARTNGTYFHALYNEERSAAALTWMYFHQSTPPPLLLHIEDRDLWKWEMEHTDAVLKGLEAEGMDVQTMDTYAHNPERLIPTGKAVCSYRDGLVDRMAESAHVRELELNGRVYTTAIVNSPVLRSRLGHKLLDDTEAEVAFVYRMHAADPGGKMSVSLRSDDDGPDVGTIAESFGGGGHDNAAGFATSFLL